MSKFTKIVIVLLIILLIEAALIYFGYARNKEPNIKPINTYDKPKLAMTALVLK